MLKVTQMLLLVIAWGFVSGGAPELPNATVQENFNSVMIPASYISKCSLSDPKLNQCLVEKANKVIPILAKGDVWLNIPPLSPTTFTEAMVHGVGLTYVLNDMYTDDLKNMVLTEAVMDFDNRVAYLEAFLHRLEFTAQNYTIIDGKILDIPVYGHGKYDWIAEGVKMKFYAKLGFYQKRGDEYLDYFNATTDVTVKSQYVYFENIKSSEKDDVNAYINENWSNFFNQLKPVADSYFDLYVNSRIKTIVNSIPFNKMFLP